jgi:hypothetical protein
MSSVFFRHGIRGVYVGNIEGNERLEIPTINVLLAKYY